MPEPQKPFDAPWQAELFALTVALNEAGAFAWSEWTDAFAQRLKATQGEGNAAFYEAWLKAFESLLVAKGIADHAQLERLVAAWQDAARQTPHGTPITLDRP
ncbi:MAG: nitrile hydratase accessory protein [Pseudomonadota bacterium]